MSPDGPVLHTNRLRLRWLNIDDASMMLEIWSCPEFVRYAGDRGIRSLTAAQSELEQITLAGYAQNGSGPFHVALLDGTPVGICGLYHRPFLNRPDLGFALLAGHRRKGYGLESAAAVLNYCATDLGFDAVYAIVAADNAPSVALLRKLGMRFERRLQAPGERDEVLLYRVSFAAGAGH